MYGSLKYCGLLLLGLLCLAPGCKKNTAPQIFPIYNQEVQVNSEVTIDITGNDLDGDALSFGVLNKPEGAVFRSTAQGARFQWTPIISQLNPDGSAKTYQITFTVDDGRGGTDSERVTITVIPTGSGSGAPVFTSPADYVLDLRLTDLISFNITVKDDDSAYVDFRIIQNIDGATFHVTGDKSASFYWKATQSQIVAKTIYTLKVGAGDRVHPEVYQNISILLRRKDSGTCPGENPKITHKELGDQHAPGPYLITAEVQDNESAIKAVTLFWSREPNPGESDFKSNVMLESNVNPGTYESSIPDPGLSPGQYLMINYFICASDNDDALADTCDHLVCQPADGQQKYHFVAYGSGASCADDGKEENDAYQAAQPINDDDLFTGLRICDDDWFKIQLSQDDRLDALITFNHDNGNLDMELYGPDGTTKVAHGVTDTDDEYISHTASETGLHYLRIFGMGGAQNTYDLAVDVVPQGVSCQDDNFEQNDSRAAARPIVAGTYANLRICSGDEDWYRIEMEQGNSLVANVFFTNSMGDLDAYLYKGDATSSYKSGTSTTDNEVLNAPNLEAGTYYLQIVGYQQDENNYSLRLETSGAVSCQEDRHEPNNTAQEAIKLFIENHDNLQVCDNSDFFYFLARANDPIKVDLLFTHNQGDLDLQVYKPDGNLLKESISEDDNEQVIDTAPATGAYTIKVSGYEGDQNSYSLNISGPGDDNFEENDSVQAAKTVTEGIYNDLRLTPDDQDNYKITLTSGQRLNILLEFKHAEGDIDLTVFDPDGENFAFAYSSTDDETIDKQATKSGTYTIIVDSIFTIDNIYSMTIVH